MDESVKKRSYNSPRRQEQARETRKRILEAAQRLFVSEGYVAATLPEVAREAGVSPATITVAFGTKLADRGFGKRHSERGAVYIGIGLRAYDEGRVG